MAVHKVSCQLQMSQSPGSACICGADRPANRVSVFTTEDRQAIADIADSQLLLVQTINEFMAAQMSLGRSVVKLAEVVASLSLTSPRE